MHVALTSYMRPELTSACLENLLKICGVSGIHVFIDGPRHSAGMDELMWRKKTIEVCTQFATENSKIFLKVWDRNIGLEENSKRCFTPLFEKYKWLAVTEEDVMLTQDSINFLKSQAAISKPGLVTSYSLASHKSTDLISRTTLFPQLWGAAYSSEIFEGSLRVRSVNKIDEKVVQESINRFFSKPSHFRNRLKSHWLWYFNYALRTHRHPDVLLQYASWEQGVFGTAPLIPLSRDISYRDWRGMNIRHNSGATAMHKSNLTKLGPANFCLNCEFESSRIEVNSMKHYWKFIKRKFGN